MAWLESHQDLRSHPKTARLKRRLGISLPTAIGHLHLLWWWALSYADDGDLVAFDADQIADAAGWEDGNADEFVRAMIAAGFLDEDLKIHDWWEYAGRLVVRREANAARMRDARHAARRATSEQPVPHVESTYAARAASVSSDINQPTNLDTEPHQPTNQPTNHYPPNPPPRAEGGTHAARGEKRPKRRNGETSQRPSRGTVPTDPAAYYDGPAGRVVAERMAAKLSGEEGV
jgi:hypothetical protein